MSTLLLAVLALTLISALVPEHAAAQVEWKDRYITIAKRDQYHASIARPTRPDYTVVVWEDSRDGHIDIYAQKIDNTTGLAMWNIVDGSPVCTADSDQVQPRAAYDTLGGIIITWEDHRNAYTVNGVVMGSEIRAQRLLLSTGELDPNWTPGGIAICADQNISATRPRIAATGEGAYLAWNVRIASDPGSSNGFDIRCTYIQSADGLPPGSNTTWWQNGNTTGTVWPTSSIPRLRSRTAGLCHTTSQVSHAGS